MQQFTPLFKAYNSRPPVKASEDYIWFMHLIRNNFTITTWLLVGAALQSILILIPIPKKYSITPALAFLLLKFVDTLLMTLDVKRNRYLNGVIFGKHAALFPSQGDELSKDDRNARGPGGKAVTVLLLSARLNHPLGLFAPGVNEFGDFMASMNADLEKNAEEFGWLGKTNWLNGQDRTATTDIMYIHYFKSLESLHRFAHSKSHREGWDWYVKFARTHKHIGVNHEVYNVPAGCWENIYLNEAPTGFGKSLIPIQGGRWASPIVDASRGKLKSSNGRLGVDDGEGNRKYGEEPWKDAVVPS